MTIFFSNVYYISQNANNRNDVNVIVPSKDYNFYYFWKWNIERPTNKARSVMQ